MSRTLASVLKQQSLHIALWQEDGVYITRCLDIPGCVSQGDSREEALANIHEAIRLCLEVIQEEAGQHTQEPAGAELEVIEEPISTYIPAH